MEFENAEQAQAAIMEFARKVLEAQHECGLNDEVIVVFNVECKGEMQTSFYGSGDPEQWAGMLQKACECANALDTALLLEETPEQNT